MERVESEEEGKNERIKHITRDKMKWICTFQTPSANMVSLAKANDPVSSVFFRISTALINSLREEAASFSFQFDIKIY
jgi:hypothetical protein